MSNLTKKCFTSVTEDEEFAEQVKSFPCLYNKSAKSYKERHVVRYGQAEVASNLEFEDHGKYFACLRSQILFSEVYFKYL